MIFLLHFSGRMFSGMHTFTSMIFKRELEKNFPPSAKTLFMAFHFLTVKKWLKAHVVQHIL